MKILQISYSLASGGGERFVVDLSNRLAENPDNNVILLTINDDRILKNIYYLKEVSPKVKFVNLHCPSGQHPLSFWRVYQAIKMEKPDIVHIHCDLLLAYFPVFFKRKTKYVHTLHSLARICLKSKWFLFSNRWLYKHRVQPITISNVCQKSYIELYKQNNAYCITNGREALVPTGHIPMDIAWNMENVPIFIHVARCHRLKNQTRLFKTFDRLQVEGIKFHLIVLGRDYESEWMLKYQNNPQIHIMGERKNVADYMVLADYFVLTSDYEGLPLTLLEAMSLGAIPICTPAGGVVDVIKDGQTGYIAPTFDNGDYYQKVKQALREKGKINKEAIKKEYNEHYSMKICAEKYMNVYNTLCHKR